MGAHTIETDYLVVGCGTGGMAFTDSLIAHSDAQVVMVDRRHRPGGHWNDAYPFVRLHVPSAYYGVSSRVLGSDAIDRVGPNADCYELASAAQICGYYDRVMQETLLPSGRVQYFPMCDYLGVESGRHRFVSRVSGQLREVLVRRKLVDATYLEGSVPATHTPQFEIAAGVAFARINDLVNVAKPQAGYVILGAGKTAIDACLWLLERGVDPEAIAWVRPRDAWLLDRAQLQPLDQVDTMMNGISLQAEAAAQAESIDDLFLQLERRGVWMRIDPTVMPSMYRCATVNRFELEQLRRIRNVVRLGRVRCLEREQIVLDHGRVPMNPDRLHVDCTAAGIPAKPARPIFETDRITLQQVRVCSPSFNSALIAFIEASLGDLAQQNRLCPMTPYPERPADWISVFHNSLLAAAQWSSAPEVQAWVEGTRLNSLRGMLQHTHKPSMQQALQRYGQNAAAALEKLARFRAEVQASA